MLSMDLEKPQKTGNGMSKIEFILSLLLYTVIFLENLLELVSLPYKVHSGALYLYLIREPVCYLLVQTVLAGLGAFNLLYRYKDREKSKILTFNRLLLLSLFVLVLLLILHSLLGIPNYFTDKWVHRLQQSSH